MNGHPPVGTEIEIERPGGRARTGRRSKSTVGPVETLADLPPLRDRLLFVGLNPSPVSVTAGHYHQGRLGRTFWQRLVKATILPSDTPIDAADDALVAAGHGITDLLKLPTARDDATDATLTPASGRSGRRSRSGVRRRSSSSTSGPPRSPRVADSRRRGASCTASRSPAGRAS